MITNSAIRKCLGDSIWVCGSSCAGKSTVCRILASKHGWSLINVDQLVDDVFPDMITAQDHPNLLRLQQNGLPWLFGKSTDNFLKFQKSANREYLDLLVMYLEKNVYANQMIVDGGELYDPDLLSQYVPTGRLVYLDISDAMQLTVWKSRNWVFDVLREFDNPDFLYQRWMELDILQSRQMIDQCVVLGLPCVRRDDTIDVQDFAKLVEEALSIV